MRRGARPDAASKPFSLDELGMHLIALRDQGNRIEHKLDVLICSLAEEDDEAPQTDLDGNEIPKGAPVGPYDGL